MRMLVTLVLLAVASTLGACGGADSSGDAAAPAAQTMPRTTTAKAPNGDIYDWIPHVYDRVAPKVVAILVSGPQGTGGGSGVIWSRDGHIVTNNHVVAGATRIQVVLQSGQRLPASVVGTDATTDLAVIEVDRDGLPVAQFAKNLPRIGSLALAIGSPLGFQSTLTQGIVSGLHRNLPGTTGQTQLVDLIQTDAPISPGNSGGALVNEFGVVIGINGAYIPPQQGAVSLGFAIPAPTVSYVVRELIRNGSVEHAFLGIQPANITPDLARQFGISVSQGVIVFDLVEGGAAGRAGIRPGDVIVQLGNRRVDDVGALLAALRGRRPGDEVDVTVVRDGDRRKVTVTLAGRSSG